MEDTEKTPSFAPSLLLSFFFFRVSIASISLSLERLSETVTRDRNRNRNRGSVRTKRKKIWKNRVAIFLPKFKKRNRRVVMDWKCTAGTTHDPSSPAHRRPIRQIQRVRRKIARVSIAQRHIRGADGLAVVIVALAEVILEILLRGRGVVELS